MSPRRSEPLTQSLLQETILSDWFEPMERALGKVRYPDAIFRSLPMISFTLLGGLRQLLSISTLREQVQTLFHWDSTAERVPVPRSTWSDAMGSGTRGNILRQAIDQLVIFARAHSTDKLCSVHGIGDRPILAIDATYQGESSHYNRVLPKEGGNDNQKGHMLLTYYDLRYALPLAIKTETQSMGEMRVLKQDAPQGTDWRRVKNAIYVVDRAFVDGRYWDQQKTQLKATVITRMKSVLVYNKSQSRGIAPWVCNENVVSDTVIELQSASQPWRLIKWQSPEGVVYEYLSNDFSLEPGVIAFLYYRRWDEEKYFDNFKNDLAHAKAWGKSPVAIEQQALLGLMAYVLTQLFLQRRCEEFNTSDQTQARKQRHKVERYLDQQDGDEDTLDEEDEPKQTMKYDAYRAFYAQLSKITRQVWRFLKNCFGEKSSSALYQRQLRPLILGYL
ncbi:MAG: transposase [Aestuariibacter sp.]|nr:transposase [Aestuariibacter sp.]